MGDYTTEQIAAELMDFLFYRVYYRGYYSTETSFSDLEAIFYKLGLLEERIPTDSDTVDLDYYEPGVPSLFLTEKAKLLMSPKSD